MSDRANWDSSAIAANACRLFWLPASRKVERSASRDSLVRWPAFTAISNDSAVRRDERLRASSMPPNSRARSARSYISSAEAESVAEKSKTTMWKRRRIFQTVSSSWDAPAALRLLPHSQRRKSSHRRESRGAEPDRPNEGTCLTYLSIRIRTDSPQDRTQREEPTPASVLNEELPR
jgi:hypothetical protein